MKGGFVGFLEREREREREREIIFLLLLFDGIF